MTKKSKTLRAFVSSCEPIKEDGKPALVPKLRFPEFRGISHAKARSREEEGGME